VYKDICFLPPTLYILAGAFTLILIFNILPICFFFYKNINLLDNNIQTLPLQIFLINSTVEPQDTIARANLRSFDHLHITNNTSVVTLPFTTGFLSIIFSSMSLFPSVFVNLLWTYYNNEVTPNTVNIGYIFSVILTTLLPIYWICSNKDLREFSIRKIKKIFEC
jgi:hypothetical protein